MILKVCIKKNTILNSISNRNLIVLEIKPTLGIYVAILYSASMGISIGTNDKCTRGRKLRHDDVTYTQFHKNAFAIPATACNGYLNFKVFFIKFQHKKL